VSEAEAAALVEAARAWLITNVWGERPGSQTWTPNAPADVVLRGIVRHYPGGMDQFVTDHLTVAPRLVRLVGVPGRR
jgi:hypothetical protein